MREKYPSPRRFINARSKRPRFCHNETRDKNYAIEKAGEEIEMLLADIQKAESDSAVAARKIAKKEELLAKLSAAKEEANAENAKVCA